MADTTRAPFDLNTLLTSPGKPATPAWLRAAKRDARKARRALQSLQSPVPEGRTEHAGTLPTLC